MWQMHSKGLKARNRTANGERAVYWLSTVDVYHMAFNRT